MSLNQFQSFPVARLNNLGDDYYYPRGGSGNSLLDHACDLLAPDLRPVPPQPNCPQSMNIFENHRRLAAQYFAVKQEADQLRLYREDLQRQLAQVSAEADNPTITQASHLE